MSPSHAGRDLRALAGLVTVVATIAGCSGGGEFSGTIQIAGSSTVAPITEVAGEEFSNENEGVSTSIAITGTGAGMSRFLQKEIDVCNASRPITEAEKQEAAAAGIEYVEFTIGYDGLAVTANVANDWCDSLTVEQLKAIWRPEAEGTVTNWNQISEGWPDEPLKLYGAGTASGTFDYFTEVINGKAKQSRSDYTMSENDNMLVRGVVGEKGSLGYFGYAYYIENKDQLKLIAIDNGNGPVKPSTETVVDGSYAPLSRPLFIYVNKESLKRPEAAAFVKFFVENCGDFAKARGYVQPPDDVQQQNLATLKASLP
ncbi:MAG: PstS family phosphate ABC transporter substrate-binding protein [Pirellulales bacterium]|nr:PstS family phosphate ABC transporter substrate-binding protein [Pirellulales bacterium]